MGDKTDVVIILQCMISGFHYEVVENCALLGYYAASKCNFLLKFWDNVL
jgi:hypothetical protein